MTVRVSKSSITEVDRRMPQLSDPRCDIAVTESELVNSSESHRDRQDFSLCRGML